MSVQDLFAVRVFRGAIEVPPHKRQVMLDKALEVNASLNPLGQPWARDKKVDLLSFSEFSELAEVVKQTVREVYGCDPTWMTAREIVQRPGQFLPYHHEDTHLSAVFYLDFPAVPRPADQDYSGCFVLTNPSGGWGIRALPWEASRSEIIAPQTGSLLIFPSYVGHHSYPHNADRPTVAVHFEILVTPYDPLRTPRKSA